MAQGDKCTFVGLTERDMLLAQSCMVTRREPVNIADTSPPRFRAINEEVYCFDKGMCNRFPLVPSTRPSDMPTHLPPSPGPLFTHLQLRTVWAACFAMRRGKLPPSGLATATRMTETTAKCIEVREQQA